MKEDKQFLMYSVGKMPEISAVVIQKAYKRYSARCYFDRLLQTYKLIQQQKEEENFKNLRVKISILVCVQKMKNKAFEKYRRERLVDIKEKLAIIKLKILFKKLKLKKKNIIEKIKKYKRRLRAAQKRRARKLEALRRENENLADQELQNMENLSIHSEEDFETTTSDREAEERAELLKKLEEDRKTRIHYGKIAHNLRDLKLPKILTSLHHQEVPLINLTPVHLKRNPVKRRFSVIKEDFPIRRVDGEEPSYMRATISFNLSKFATKAESFDDERNTIYGQIRDKSTLFEQTKASLLKISNKKRSLSAEDDPGECYKKPSVKFISVKIREKPKKTEMKKRLNTVVVKNNEVSTDAFSMLPGISTRHQILPVKVKPRAGLMRGFTKTRKKSDFFYDL